jgi:ketosteroid isomerase-like protein
MRRLSGLLSACILNEENMTRIFFSLAMLVAASFLLSSCGAPAANNTGNKSTNSNSSTATAVDTKAVEGEIRKLVSDYAAALANNDTAAFEKFASDNYMMVGPDGSVASRAERIESMKAGNTKYETVIYDDVNIRVNAEGNGAIAISKVTVKGKTMGKQTDGLFRVSQVWAKTKDGWKMASGHVTPIIAKDGDPPVKDANKAGDDKKTDPTPGPPPPVNK